MPGLQSKLKIDGQLSIGAPHTDEPFTLHYDFIHEAKQHCLLHAPIKLSIPMRILHGLQDESVAYQTAVEFVEKCDSPDLQLTLINQALHAMDGPRELKLISDKCLELIKQIDVTDAYHSGSPQHAKL